MLSVFLSLYLSLLALGQAKPVDPTSALTRSVGGVSRSLFLSLTERSDPSSENVVISPVSVWLALAMLHQGAAGTTRRELEEFLELPGPGGLDTGALLQDYAERRAELNTTIQLANIMFADKSLPVRKEYQRDLATSLKSQVRQADFSQQVLAAKEINDWVENKTNHLITDFISPDILSPSTRLLVLNAIYFKANWKYPFLKFDTLNSVKFEVTENSDVEVDMMAKSSDSILYQSNSALQSDIVSLPYEDENFQMMVFLPHDNSDGSLQNLIRKFQSVDFNKIYSELTESSVDLYLPKFSIGFKSELVTTLMSHGLRSMFNPEQADFSKISEESLRVSNILHETKVEVTEEGSEAAGITGAVLDLRASVSHSHEVNVNRPFVFVIQDRKNNIPLFIGKVVNPSSEEPRQKQTSADLENFIAVRTPDLDQEDLAHFVNNPQDFVDPRNCSKVEYINSEKVYFPCGDTEPIENYRREHGDPSVLGINGEQAALVNI